MEGSSTPGNCLVVEDSRVVNYDCRVFIRLATGTVVKEKDLIMRLKGVGLNPGTGYKMNSFSHIFVV